jgi:hypothetical protein
MSDVYGNPEFVVTDELIESAWGNAVSSTIVHRYPTLGAFQAAWPAPPENLVVAIGGNEVFVVRGGRLKGVASDVTQSVRVASGNVSGGGVTSEIFSTLDIPAHFVDRTFLATWNMVGGGQGAPGAVACTIRLDPATVIGSTPPVSFVVGQSVFIQSAAYLAVPFNTAVSFHWYVTISGTGSNMNIDGYAYALAFPR